MTAAIALTDVSAWISQDDKVLEQLVTQLPARENMAVARLDAHPSMAQALAQRLEQRPELATSTVGLVDPESITEQLSAGGAISLRMSASEPLSAHMFGVSMTERLAQIEHVCESARDAGVPVRIYLHAAFSCPYDGPTQAQAVAGLAAKLLRLGSGEFFLLDDCATVTPDHLRYRVEVLTTQVARGRMGFLANANNPDTDALINQAASMGIKKFAGAALPGLSLLHLSPPYTVITLTQLIEILVAHSPHNQDS